MSRRRPPTSRPRRADAGPPTATPLGLRGWARVAALYGLLLAAVYAPVVFGGRTLAPEAYQPYGMTEHGAWQAPPRTPGYAFMADLGTPAYYEAPVNRVVGARWRRGEVPLWSPWQGLGAPLVAQYSSRALFPYQVLEDLAPSTWADAFLLGRLWIAALCTFGFVRRLVARDDVALAGGALYALSGSLVWFVNLEQMANVAMTVPAFFWASSSRVRRRRSCSSAASPRPPSSRSWPARSGRSFARGAAARCARASLRARRPPPSERC